VYQRVGDVLLCIAVAYELDRSKQVLAGELKAVMYHLFCFMRTGQHGLTLLLCVSAGSYREHASTESGRSTDEESTQHDEQQEEEDSGTFSARALRRSGWQQPPTHRSSLPHQQEGPDDAAESNTADEYAAKQAAKEDMSPEQPPGRRRALQTTHDQHAWSSALPLARLLEA
jgi:hypothetical protein